MQCALLTIEDQSIRFFQFYLSVCLLLLCGLAFTLRTYYESANRTFLHTRKRRKQFYEGATTFCYKSAQYDSSTKFEIK